MNFGSVKNEYLGENSNSSLADVTIIIIDETITTK